MIVVILLDDLRRCGVDYFRDLSVISPFLTWQCSDICSVMKSQSSTRIISNYELTFTILCANLADDKFVIRFFLFFFFLFCFRKSGFDMISCHEDNLHKLLKPCFLEK